MSPPAATCSRKAYIAGSRPWPRLGSAIVAPLSRLATTTRPSAPFIAQRGKIRSRSAARAPRRMSCSPTSTPRPGYPAIGAARRGRSAPRARPRGTPRDHFLEQFQALLAQGDIETRQARNVATRPGETGDEPRPHRIGSIPRTIGMIWVASLAASAVMGLHDEHVNGAHQVRRQLRQPGIISFGIAVLDSEVLALHVAQLAHTLLKCSYTALDRFRGGGRLENRSAQLSVAAPARAGRTACQQSKSGC